ncbi:hypothetical protein LJY25_09075 [Hymenobacter sp. BT175]|uniref:hypothetical protein n=1 Tax=Hymenobacter translucens TaxID=2886507 RepID=UPI001D0E34F8|nr:hypothetical protein [Hymenobacter translucens]MCC2546593.1 hypothetical protein [Hymenobacter translucens]
MFQRLPLLWLLNFLCLLGVAATSSCFLLSREPEPEPYGSISGSVSPAQAVYSVSAKGMDGQLVDFTLPNANGLYKLDGLAAGNYIIVYNENQGFNAPFPLRATIKGGSDTSLPLAVATVRNGSTGGGSGSFSVDNTAYAVSQTSGSFFSGSLIVRLTGPTSPVSRRVEVTFFPAMETGSYTDGSVPGRKCTLVYTQGSVDYNSVNGTAQLTSLDTAARRASGTYSFSVATPGGAPATVTGTFTNVPF